MCLPCYYMTFRGHPRSLFQRYLHFCMLFSNRDLQGQGHNLNLNKQILKMK